MTELEMRARDGGKRDRFMSGVLVLTLASVIVKIIGLVYKIPMLTLLGSEGMGYFNSAYEIYMLFGVVSTAGLPVAMSVMISGARERGEMSEKRIFSISLTLFLILGIVGSLLMLALSRLSSRVFGSGEVIFSVIAISPTVFFICLSSVYRGFFQGLGRMAETAISQVIEAALKLVLGLIFAYIAIRGGYGVPEVAAFAVLGLTLGSAVSALYLMLSKSAYDRREEKSQAARDARDEREEKSQAARDARDEREEKAQAARDARDEREGKAQAARDARDEREEKAQAARKKRSELLTAEGCASTKSILRTLLMTAIPITLSSLVMNVTKIIDMTVILRRMQDIGYTSAEAFSAYGSYTTLALPLFSLAPALISSVALPLVPSLSAAVAGGDADGQVSVIGDAIRLTMIVSVPISLGLSFFSNEILSLIFGGEPHAVALSTPLLSILALSIPLACLITVENAVLQAYGAASLPMISMIVGSLIKIISAYFLIGNGAVNIAGAPISTFFCDLLINAVNWSFIEKRLPHKAMLGDEKGLSCKISLGIFAKPFLAAFICVGTARLVYSAISVSIGESRLITLATIAFCAVIYLPISLIVGAITKEDIKKPLLRRNK